MNFNMVGIVALIGGVVLMYAAVKDASPITVVQNALNGKPTNKPRRTGGGTFGTPSDTPITPNDGTKVVSV